MIRIKNHEVIHKENDYVELILHLDPGSNFFEEFSKELGQQNNELEVHHAAQDYIRRNLPNSKFNKIKVMVGSVVVATLLGVTLVAPAGNLASAETSSSQVAISGGQLAVNSLAVGTFTAVTLEGRIQSTYADISSFTVSDPSGTGAGWNVVMSASQFTDATTNRTLPSGSLSVKSPNIAIAETGSSPTDTIVRTGGIIDDPTGIKILSAPVDSGMGTYTVSFDPDALSLQLLPKDVKTGTYTSTITVEINNGP